MAPIQPIQLLNYDQASAALTTKAAGATDGGFGSLLARAVESVQVAQDQAAVAATQVVDGTGSVHASMIALQQAEAQFQLLLQVRNKVQAAYEDIMRMQI